VAIKRFGFSRCRSLLLQPPGYLTIFSVRFPIGILLGILMVAGANSSTPLSTPLFISGTEPPSYSRAPSGLYHIMLRLSLSLRLFHFSLSMSVHGLKAVSIQFTWRARHVFRSCNHSLFTFHFSLFNYITLLDRTQLESILNRMPISMLNPKEKNLRN